MFAWIIEGDGHRPMLRFEDGRTGIPVNLRLLSRREFVELLGRRVEVRSQLSPDHYTVRFSGADEPHPA
jgi:hypothetical protein